MSVGEIGAICNPEAQPDASMAPFDSFLGQSPSLHRAPSPVVPGIMPLIDHNFQSSEETG
jgi:hypothetical protein